MVLAHWRLAGCRRWLAATRAQLAATALVNRGVRRWRSGALASAWQQWVTHAEAAIAEEEATKNAYDSLSLDTLARAVDLWRREGQRLASVRAAAARWTQIPAAAALRRWRRLLEPMRQLRRSLGHWVGAALVAALAHWRVAARRSRAAYAAARWRVANLVIAVVTWRQRAASLCGAR